MTKTIWADTGWPTAREPGESVRKMSRAQVAKLREWRAQGMSYAEIMRRTGLKRSRLAEAVNGLRFYREQK